MIIIETQSQSNTCTEYGDCDERALHGECEHYDPRDIDSGRPGVVIFYIHKFEVSQAFGGPEEGSWYYEVGTPCEDWDPLKVAVYNGHENDNEAVFDLCRMFNAQEHKRREGLQYGYHSVLSYREEFYSYDISYSRVARPYPRVRPHYE